MRARSAALLAIWLGCSVPAHADLSQSWRSADEAAPYLMVGEQIWLEAQAPFWLAYRETPRKKNRGTLIILPDSTLTPVVQHWVLPLTEWALRTGWHVAALQADTDDAVMAARLDSVVAWLINKQQLHFALLGIGTADRAVLNYAEAHPPAEPPPDFDPNNPPPPEPAVRVLGLLDPPWPGDKPSAAALAQPLGRIHIPVADFYRVQGGDWLERWAEQRRVAAKPNDDFRQLRLRDPEPREGADDNLSVRRLIGWLGNAMQRKIDEWPKPPPAPENTP